MDIELIHNYFNFLFRKERTGFIPHEDIDIVLDRVQMQVFADYFSIYGANQMLHDALKPFKLPFSAITTIAGVATLPPDYVHLLNADVTAFDNALKRAFKKSVFFPEEDQYTNALNSQLRPVSLTRPIGKLVGNTIDIEPKAALAVSGYYLRRPATPKFVYTLVNRVVTYNLTASTQVEFADIYIDKIISKCLPYLGINLTDITITQFGEMKDKQIQ